MPSLTFKEARTHRGILSEVTFDVKRAHDVVDILTLQGIVASSSILPNALHWMEEDAAMTREARSELIDELRPRYVKATKKERSAILDAVVYATGYHRRYPISLFRHGYPRRVRRSRKYQRFRRIFARLASQVVSAWRQHFVERATSVFSTLESERAEQKRIADPERMGDRLTMELEVVDMAKPVEKKHRAS